MDTLPIVWQYVILGTIALGATLVGLWLYNRREKRRKHALELMRMMDQWSLDWFAGLYADYAVGDYSGLASRIKEVVQAVRSDEAMVAKLGEVAKKVAAYYASNDATKAAELTAILRAGNGKPQAAP
ncbi:MAG: hypothetical protein KKA28_12745 [Planctomycetes bacterium]|nr:hypothetical protein [Planctomycetota bacterium]MCG2685519.1 hypothetical protein [Planctomycetales bacterium]